MSSLVKFLFIGWLILLVGCSNEKPPLKERNDPKLVVGIVVDQMRYEMLQRYSSQFSEDGFNRFLKQGFSFTNCNYSYTPTYTGPGHATIFTGKYPKNHKIIANDWYDRKKRSTVYCVEDPNTAIIGNSTSNETGSPKNLKAFTISDWLFKDNSLRESLSFSIKDRGSILPGGTSKNGAFWMDNLGNFITSDYYYNALPEWVTAYNNQNRAEYYLDQGWDIAFPIDYYTESHPDAHPFESKYFNETATLPYDLNAKVASNGNQVIKSTPYGNTMLVEIAEGALNNEALGQDSITDFLSISFSSTDYIGHEFGPQSIEVHDTYLRLDRDLATLFSLLDEKVGRGAYIVFLTSDHGAANLPDTALANKAYFRSYEIDSSLTWYCRMEWNANMIQYRTNFQIYLNTDKIIAAQLDEHEVKSKLMKYMASIQYFEQIWDIHNVDDTIEPQKMSTLGGASGDIAYTLPFGKMERQWGTTHGTGYIYDTHVPCLWYGAGIIQGEVNHPIQVVDIAPTLLDYLKLNTDSLDGVSQLEHMIKQH